jgi:hypothetical protein
MQAIVTLGRVRGIKVGVHDERAVRPGAAHDQPRKRDCPTMFEDLRSANTG